MKNEEQKQQQMMNEEYGKEFGGCLWFMIACFIAIAFLGCLILFT